MEIIMAAVANILLCGRAITISSLLWGRLDACPADTFASGIDYE